MATCEPVVSHARSGSSTADPGGFGSKISPVEEEL